MALRNLTDPALAADRLAAALHRHLPGARDVRVSGVTVPAANGLSTETVLFDACWSDAAGAAVPARLVARVQPTGPAVFPRYDLAREAAVLHALHAGSDVPVPEVLFHEPDAALLGAPFLVMRRVDGLVASDDPPFSLGGWLFDLAPERQARLHGAAVRVLAGIHAVDLDRAGLGWLRGHPESGLDGQLDFWWRTFEWAAEGQHNPTVLGAFDWVRRHRPAEPGDPVLCWGDARIGNLIVGPGQGVEAVLDWEMTCAGPPGLDLGWFLFLSRYYAEGIGAPPLPGFPDRDTVLEQYRRAGGADPGDVHFYEVFAGLRLAVLMHRAGNLMIAAGQRPPGAPMRTSNPASRLLAGLAGLPEPEGETQSFAGNR
jgi:aminoglycoside phosphotransferase (APT) family kinase protein